MDKETVQEKEKMMLYRECIDDMLKVIDRDIINSDDLSLPKTANANDYFETTAQSLQGIITTLTTNDYDYRNKIIYLNYQHSANPDQMQIVFPEKKTVLIVSEYDGRLKAAWEFAEKYCSNIETEYINMLYLEKTIENKCFDVIIILENISYTDEYMENELPKICGEKTKLLYAYKYKNFENLDVLFNSLFLVYAYEGDRLQQLLTNFDDTYALENR